MNLIDFPRTSHDYDYGYVSQLDHIDVGIPIEGFGIFAPPLKNRNRHVTPGLWLLKYQS